MKRILMALVAAASLTLVGTARADHHKEGEKADCSAQKTAHEEAVTASKAKPDLSTCADKKGKEKTECEKPLKDQAKEASVAAKVKVKEAKMTLDCCKNPKKKGCGEPAPAAAPAPAPAK